MSPTFISAIRSVVSTDQRYFCRNLTAMVMDSVFDEVASLPSEPELTPREQDVLKLIAEGRSAEQIASMLGLTESTVRSYRSNIMRNLDLHIAQDLTRYAISDGISTGHRVAA
jgi:DNA-binding NarL/FixJ family response regulator